MTRGRLRAALVAGLLVAGAAGDNARAQSPGAAPARDSAARLSPDLLSEGMLVEVRFAAPREVVLLMPAGETLALPAVEVLVGRVLGVSEERVIRLRVASARGAPGAKLPRRYAGGTAFVISDGTVSLATATETRRSPRAVDWIFGGLVPVALFVYILKHGL